jgi:hypothetical protein
MAMAPVPGNYYEGHFILVRSPTKDDLKVAGIPKFGMHISWPNWSLVQLGLLEPFYSL